MTHYVVTSFSERGYDTYGRRFLETFRRHWPPDVELIVYHEGTVLPDWCVGRRLLDVADCAAFIERHRFNTAVQGRTELLDKPWKPKCRLDGYNFRFDAYKFCRKIFALADAARILRQGKLFWLDADTVTVCAVPAALLDELLPDGYAISFLERWRDYHSECGFVGYNLFMDSTHEFIKRFVNLYVTDRFVGYPEWHDSYLFDCMRKETSVKAYSIASRSLREVFNTSPLGRYVHHLKGERKWNANL